MSYSAVETSPAFTFSYLMSVLKDNFRSIISPKEQAFKKAFSDALRSNIEKEELKNFIEENTDTDIDYLADAYFKRFDPKKKPRPPFDGTKNNPHNMGIDNILAAAMKLAEETGMKLCLDEIRPDGTTALHVAATARPVRLKMILAFDQPYNPNRRNLTGSTPMDVATQEAVDFILGLSSEQLERMADPNSDELRAFQDKQSKIDFLFEHPGTDVRSWITANKIVETAIDRHKDEPQRQDHVEFLETLSLKLENIKPHYLKKSPS